uniref:Uncharacterized protein n=1 Tax=Pyrodinium bahamense TaxID=73915 RepID=A0A7S0FL78_9DINO
MALLESALIGHNASLMKASFGRVCSSGELTTTSGGSSGADSPYNDTFCAESIPDVDTTSAPPCSWRIVWCWERCHKQEAAYKREVLGEAARKAGASLVCLKKANKFAAWLAKSQRPPYILLTDWRELKPCLSYASQEHLSNQPVFTVVLCEDPEKKPFGRAAAWAERVGPRPDPVHVCKDLDFLLAFLDKLGGCPRPAKEPPTPIALEPRIAQALGCPPPMPWTPPYMAPPAVPAPCPTMPCFGQLVLATTPISARPPSPDVVAPATTSAMVQQVLSQVGAPQDATELARVLRAAMPESYDE